jgi:hypothetical protein
MVGLEMLKAQAEGMAMAVRAKDVQALILVWVFGGR